MSEKNLYDILPRVVTVPHLLVIERKPMTYDMVLTCVVIAVFVGIVAFIADAVWRMP